MWSTYFQQHCHNCVHLYRDATKHFKHFYAFRRIRRIEIDRFSTFFLRFSRIDCLLNLTKWDSLKNKINYSLYTSCIINYIMILMFKCKKQTFLLWYAIMNETWLCRFTLFDHNDCHLDWLPAKILVSRKFRWCKVKFMPVLGQDKNRSTKKRHWSFRIVVLLWMETTWMSTGDFEWKHPVFSLLNLGLFRLCVASVWI